MAVALAALAMLDPTGQPASGADAAPTRPRPILDTHIHLYKVTRPGGVPWPKPVAKPLYRDVLPEEYEALARAHGVVGTGIVEASPLPEDNFAVLAQVAGRPLFRFYVAQLEIGAPDFPQRLAALAKDRRVVGIRGFLWSPKLTLSEEQLAHLRLLASTGMTLDLVSRGKLNPKHQVVALARAVPQLRIIIDHLGGAKAPSPSPEWVADVRSLAAHRNVHMKLSSFFDIWNPIGREEQPWQSPTDVAAYKPFFDVLLEAFGADRLVWGSNWPVCELGGGFAAQIRLAEAYLAPHGRKVRDKVMFENARRFYRRTK